MVSGWYYFNPALDGARGVMEIDRMLLHHPVYVSFALKSAEALKVVFTPPF